MAIRAAKQYTDRGSIKDLVNKRGKEAQEIELPVSSGELRMKKLYEYAHLNKDHNLQGALGFITTDYISDKNALPLSIYRLRKTVADIKSKSSNNIDQMAAQLSSIIGNEISPKVIEYLCQRRAVVKTASKHKPIFWRK